MRRATRIQGFICALLLVVTSSVLAQAPDVQRDLASALRVVRPLVRDDPARAIQMLQALSEEYPTNPHVLMLLGEAYRISGDNEAAREAYARCLQFNPMHLQSGAALGVLYIQDGQTKQGKRVFDDLIDRTQHGINAYRTIASTLQRNGYVDMALDYYEAGRAANDDNYILTLDIAYLYRSMGKYEQALVEYLRVVEVNPKQHRLVKSRIGDLLRDEEADTDALIDVLEETVETPGRAQGLAMEVLATSYLDRGMLESAFDMAVRAEGITQEGGAILFRLAEASLKEYEQADPAERASYFDLSLRALEAFLGAHPDSPQVPGAKLMLVELLLDLASGTVQAPPGTQLDSAVARAIEALDWLIDSFPGTDYAEQAYLKKGDLVFRVQKDAAAARAIYKEGMGNARFYRGAFAERLGRVYLITEEYDDARAHFTTLVNSDNEELRETGIFYSALMFSFTGDYETARDTLTALAGGNPSSQFANDALDLAWILEEGLQGDQRVLGSYVRSIQSELADDTTAVIAELRKVAGSSADTPLRPRGLIRLGEFYQARLDNGEAIETYELFVGDYPDDVRVPDVRRKIGQVYERGYGDAELALQTYEDILITYPYYIFLDEVRADVARLRASTGGPP